MSVTQPQPQPPPPRQQAAASATAGDRGRSRGDGLGKLRGREGGGGPLLLVVHVKEVEDLFVLLELLQRRVPELARVLPPPRNATMVVIR